MASRDHIPATPPPHDCSQEHRIQAIEARVHDHGVTLTQHAIALTDGKIEFASIKKDLAQIIQNQNELKAALSDKPAVVWQKILDAVIFWAVPLIGGGLLWVIAKSGQIPGAHP